MAKLIFSVALVSALLVIIATTSSAYRTTITTIEVDDINPGDQSEQRCEQEKRKDLSACVFYLKESGSRRGDMIKMPGEDNPQGKLEECCSELNQVKDECQCVALKAIIAKDIEIEHVQRKEEYQKVMEKARNIPSSCGMKQKCQF